eukprot:CAMPEP_0180768346 /NCGR_PEP_ID=MMETSP1038_2-20121128/40516_1 /TAXON_ID=632150 /ORGANISM="Azadinium spinosum, Strain 3D9" /LENGTH=43 /DNA_ID= /DNA_START= /DNA_END= /DNA_ORIENTATION=
MAHTTERYACEGKPPTQALTIFEQWRYGDTLVAPPWAAAIDEY